MRFLKYILILPVLAYGLVWGYLWYDAYSALSKLTQSTESFANVEYDSFFVSPLGNEFTVDGIVIVPLIAPDEFRIEQVRIAADQIGFFLLAGNSMKEGEPPENLTVSFKNIQFNLDSKLFAMLEKMASNGAAEPQQSNMPFANIDALGCGYVEKFELSTYRQMGFNQINADLNIDMDFDKISEVMRVQLDANTRGIYNASVTTELYVPGGKVSAMGQNANNLPPVRLSIDDTGFYKKRNTFCAGANESSVEEYVDKHMQLLTELIGMPLPQKIATAYRNHMLKGGKISVSIRPKENINGDELAYYKPVEALDLLGLKITIGKTRIDIEQLLSADASMLAKKESTTGKETSTKVEEPQKGIVAKPEEKSTVSEKSSTEEPTKEAAKQPVTQQQTTKDTNPDEPMYHVEKVEEAHQYMDKMVEVTLPDNKVRHGLLGQIRNNRIYLIMELRGGNLTYPVKISEIKKFRVLY